MQRIYVLGFSAFSGIGTRRFGKIVAAFGSVKKAWFGDNAKLIDILGQKIGKRFVDFRNKFDLQKYREEVEKKNILFITQSEKKYPVFLRKIANPPFIIFAKGNVSLLQSNLVIGVVGTRKPTTYGEEVTKSLVSDLVQKGFVIVSGLALGIDSIAHKETLKNKGQTIAVLGSGVDIPTPREHTFLYRQILENDGLIVSAFRPGEDASKGSFPARNAIIAGISGALLVTEGASDSGSLITAEYAKKFNRMVFAVPGQITSAVSKGTNILIKNGAIPALSSEDILDKLGIIGKVKTQNAKGKSFPKSTREEQEILQLLENAPLFFDEIVRKIGKDSKNIGSLLSLMELKGTIKSTTDGRFTCLS